MERRSNTDISSLEAFVAGLIMEHPRGEQISFNAIRKTTNALLRGDKLFGEVANGALTHAAWLRHRTREDFVAELRSEIEVGRVSMKIIRDVKKELRSKNLI